MSRCAALALVLTPAVAAAAVVLAAGSREREVDVESVMEIWGDVLRDVDQLGLGLTRISDRREAAIGLEIAASEPWPVLVGLMASYVRSIGGNLTPYIWRSGITYEFHVVDAELVNAFALPGGQVFVTRGMIEFTHSEAELAAVIAHEMAHVDLRHCVERYQYGARLQQAGLGSAGNFVQLAHVLVAAGYTKYQEFDADAQGTRMAMQAGYAPLAPDLLARMRERLDEPLRTRSRNPIEEVARVGGLALGSYSTSHPPSSARARQLEAQISTARRRGGGRELYVGTENHRTLIGRARRRFAGETRRY